MEFNLFSSLQLIPTEGMVRRNNHLKIGRYHQHLHELLDMDVSPIAYMMKQFPEELKEIDAVRKIIGRYGITGKAQVRSPGPRPPWSVSLYVLCNRNRWHRI